MAMALQHQSPKTSLGLGSQPRFQTIASTDTRILGKEEMRDLRQRLQSEAENIARWKASTEIKSKNMQRDIEVKNNIIEDQRSNLMEVQLHSEHLSQSLFQERQERELVNTKVSNTRQLFLTLQEQYQQLFQTVSTFQSGKDEIEKEHDGLMEKLTDLKQSFELQEDLIENMVSKAEEDLSLFKNARDSWEKNIKEKDQEIEDLTVQFESLKATSTQLTESLESAKGDMSSMESAKAHLSSELDEVKVSFLKTQEELKEQRQALTDQITKSDQELKLAHEQLQERTKEFEEAAEKIQYLKKVNDTLEGRKSELAERVTALATRKQELEDEINYKENVIQTLETAQSQSLTEINALSERLNDMCTQLSEAEDQRSNSELERNSVIEKLESTKKKLIKKKKLVEQFKEQISSFQTDLAARQEAYTRLEEENKSMEESNQNYEVAVNGLNQEITICKDNINDLTQKIAVTENYNAELQEEKTKLKMDLEKASSDLKMKTQECESLEETVNLLREDMKKLEKEYEVKVKNASGETKSKRLLEQKINSLEEKLKKSTKSVENLEAKLKAMKTSLNEKEKEVENLEVSLDKALCEKQEIECRYEAKDQALKSYQSSTATTLKTLQKELESTQEEFQKTKVDHEQHVLQLQEELDKARESLNSSISAHERHLQETTKALHEEHDTTLAECQKEITTLKAKVDAVMSELEQAKQEGSAAMKDKLQIKLESDNKVKEMGDLLDIYKTDKETKLKSAEEELQKSKSQIALLMQEKDELLAKIKTLTQPREVTATLKPAVEQVTETDDPSLRTPSPNTYLKSMNVFAEPSIPPAPRGTSVMRKMETNKFQGKQPGASILKTGRRTLLPPEYQKRVVFKPMTPIKDYGSGDSSSEACAFEIADCDELFEDMKRARKHPGIRSEKVPRANVAPFMSENNPSQSERLPLTEQDMNKEVNKEAEVVSIRKKRGRGEPKQNLKTYSAISPKNKQAKTK